MIWLAMAAVGAVGAYARYRLSNAVSARRPGAFPWGTFVVNLTGAFALGMLTGAGVSGDALLICGTGTLGAYTTFSTWMVEAVSGAGVRYIAVSMAGGLVTAGLGWLLAAAV
jgi:fluoride exporter